MPPSSCPRSREACGSGDSYTIGAKWSVVELFAQTGGAPLAPGEFRASAAPFPRVAAQLQVDAACASELIAFSVADYLLTPTRRAADLLSSYLEYIHNYGNPS
jgi:hypothetical protein